MHSLQERTSRDITSLCVRYKETGDPKLREQLVLQHVHLVKWAVDRVAYTGTTAADRDDLISEGMVGLIDAIDRYDPDRGIQLSTFATFRIRGQIADALRSRDLLPRSARRRVRELQEAVNRYTAASGHLPDEEQLASMLGESLDDVRRTLVDASLEIHSLDAPRGPDDERLSLLGMLPSPPETEPDTRHEDEELRAELRKALTELPERQRLILSLYYVEDLTMKEIGQVLGVSESRISQLHAQAIVSLRALLRQAGYVQSCGDGDSDPTVDGATEDRAAQRETADATSRVRHPEGWWVPT